MHTGEARICVSSFSCFFRSKKTDLSLWQVEVKAVQTQPSTPELAQVHVTDPASPPRNFFFLWYGRYRSKARSWNWYKQFNWLKNSTRNTMVSLRWGQIHTEHQPDKTKTTKSQTTHKSPGQICVSPRKTTAKQQRKRGQSPTQTKHKIDLPLDTMGLTHRVSK